MGFVFSTGNFLSHQKNLGAANNFRLLDFHLCLSSEMLINYIQITINETFKRYIKTYLTCKFVQSSPPQPSHREKHFNPNFRH